ncbi:MAG: insulinase family protein [Alphaproteobacteria bacterium]|nr:insulinase family protein [Alphaproteobacteria bacterium]
MLFIILCAPLQARAGVFDAQSFTLQNGLQVVVIPNHRAPVATHMVWYRVGAADEAPGQSGVAHFLEHLMFKGSGDLAPGEFSRRVRAMAGQDNAFTSRDYTAYFQSIPVEHLQTVMRMEAQRMRGLYPPLKEVESERQVILEERMQRTENDPQARLAEEMDAALFVNHPYAKPVIGWRQEMEQLTWPQAKAFYDIWYAPNNAILVISGAVDAAQVQQWAQEIYGPLKPEIIPARNWPRVPALEARKTVTLRDDSNRQPMVQIAFRVPGFRQDKKAALALEVLADILGNGPSARLYRHLVSEQKVAVDAGISFRKESWDEGDVTLYAAPANLTPPEQVITALEMELRAIIEQGVSTDEVAQSIKRLQAQAVYARDSLAGPAMIVGQALITGASLEDVETWPQAIAAVTADDVQAAANAYLNPDHMRGRAPVVGLLPEAEGE